MSEYFSTEEKITKFLYYKNKCVGLINHYAVALDICGK